jgi:hypothetical protein
VIELLLVEEHHGKEESLVALRDPLVVMYTSPIAFNAP